MAPEISFKFAGIALQYVSRIPAAVYCSMEKIACAPAVLHWLIQRPRLVSEITPIISMKPYCASS